MFRQCRSKTNLMLAWQRATKAADARRHASPASMVPTMALKECATVTRRTMPVTEPRTHGGPSDALHIARVNQPDLGASRDERRGSMTFVTDILPNNAVDLRLKMKLSTGVDLPWNFRTS